MGSQFPLAKTRIFATLLRLSGTSIVKFESPFLSFDISLNFDPESDERLHLRTLDAGGPLGIELLEDTNPHRRTSSTASTVIAGGGTPSPNNPMYGSSAASGSGSGSGPSSLLPGRLGAIQFSLVKPHSLHPCSMQFHSPIFFFRY